MDRIFRKNIYAYHLQNLTHRLVKTESLIENGNHQVNAHGDPDLGFHGVLREPVEGFDSQVLLDPFEKEFDLPARFVDLRDNHSVDGEVVGDEHQQLFRFCIPKAYTPESVRILSSALGPVQTNRLIAAQSARLVYRPGFFDVVAHVFLRSCNKENQGCVDTSQPFEIDVSTIHDIECSSLENNPIQSMDVVSLAIGDRDEHRDGALQIDNGVKLDCAFGFPESRPREEAEAQIDGGCVQGIDALVDLFDVGVASVQHSRLSDKNLSEFEEDTPVAVFVGVGEIGSSRFPTQPHGVKKSALRTQTRLDISQALPEGELSEGHAKELIPGREALASAGHGKFGYTSFELFPVNSVEDLKKDETARIHAVQSQ